MPSIFYILFLFDLNKKCFLISIFLCFALVQRTVDFHWYRTEYTNTKFLGYNVFNTTTEALIVRVKFIIYIHQWIQLFPYLKTKHPTQTCCCLWKRGGSDFWYLEKPSPDGPLPCRPVPPTFSTTFTMSSPPLVRICTTGSSLASPGTGTSRVCGCCVGRACWDSEWRRNHACYILRLKQIL